MNSNFKKVANRILRVSIFAFTVSSCQNNMDIVDPTEKNDVIQKLEAHGFTISSSPLTRSSSDIYQITEENVDEFLRDYELVRSSIENNPTDTTVIFDLIPIENRIKTRSNEPATEKLITSIGEKKQGPITHKLQIKILYKYKDGTYKLEDATYDISGTLVGSWEKGIKEIRQMSNNKFRIETYSTNIVSYVGTIAQSAHYNLEWMITVDVNSNNIVKATVRVL